MCLFQARQADCLFPELDSCSRTPVLFARVSLGMRLVTTTTLHITTTMALPPVKILPTVDHVHRHTIITHILNYIVADYTYRM